jgi:hypothetical protein
MANVISSKFKQMLLKNQVAVLSDTFKIILMQPGFVFNNTTQFAYANVSASELATAYGYIAGGIVLTGVSLVENASTGIVTLSWVNAQFNASGGSLLTSSAIIYDDTVDTGAGDDYSDVIVMCLTAGATLTAIDGTPIVVHDIYLTV